MATCITGGRTRSCSTAISGGCNFLYLVDFEDVDSVTIAPSGDATGIVMNPISAVFFKFQFAPNTAAFTESITNENCATQVTQSFVMSWNGRKQTDVNLIKDLADCCCGMVAIHGENTGTSWVWGYNETEEVFLSGVEGTSGTAKSDANQEVVTLTAISTKKAVVWTPGVAGIPV